MKGSPPVIWYPVHTETRSKTPATLADSAKQQALALANLAKEGVKIEPLPESVLASLRAAWGEIAKEEGDRDYFFKTVLDDIENFMAKSQEAPGSQAAPVQSAAP